MKRPEFIVTVGRIVLDERSDAAITRALRRRFPRPAEYDRAEVFAAGLLLILEELDEDSLIRVIERNRSRAA